MHELPADHLLMQLCGEYASQAATHYSRSLLATDCYTSEEKMVRIARELPTAASLMCSGLRVSCLMYLRGGRVGRGGEVEWGEFGEMGGVCWAGLG